MKKLSLIALFLSLGLFTIGCETATEDAADANIDAAGEQAEADMAADEAAAGNIDADEAADEADEATDATLDAADENADAAAEEPLPVTPQ